MNTPAQTSAAQPLICETVEDLYSARGRAVLSRACREHLEENRITALELLSLPDHAKLVVSSETLYSALVHRVAVVQAQALKQPISNRTKKLVALCNQAYTQTLSFEKKLPQGSFPADTLSALVRSDPLYGERMGFSALSRLLNMAKSWTEKAERCFALIGAATKPACDATALGVIEQMLAELLLARTGAPELLGKAHNAQHRVHQLLSMLSPQFALPETEIRTPAMEMLSDLNLHNKTPALRDAIMQLLRRLLESNVPLRSDDAMDEFSATREAYQLLTQNRDLSVELGVADIIEARMKRLVTSENLARLIPAAHFGPKLMQAFFVLEQTIGDGAREILLKYITYILEHRDLEKEFADPSLSQAERVEMATELRSRVNTAGLSENRRERTVLMIDALIQKLKAGEQRRAPRTMCGPEDHVVVEGVKAQLRNWSAVGLLFGPLTNSLEAGQQLNLMVRIKNPKLTLGFEAVGEVVRAGSDGMVAMKYTAKDKSIAKTIAQYFDPVGKKTSS